MQTNSAVPKFPEICKAIQNRKDWGIAALRELVACDSIAPNELRCQQILFDLLSIEGLQVRLVPLDEAHLKSLEWFTEDGLTCENRPNLVAQFGESMGRSLLFNGHIDTVSWEDQLDHWTFHPLSATVKDGKLYGRGAVDDKGPLVASAMAILALKDLGYTPPGKVILESVIGEEPSGNGTLALCEAGFLADGAINLEPTSNQIQFGHRGVIGFRFMFQGRAMHGSVAAEVENAIVRAGKFAELFSKSLDCWSHPQDDIYGPPTTNVGTIKGGTDIFTTPSYCQLECAVRYAPGTFEQIIAHIEGYLKDTLGESFSIRQSIFLHHDASEVAPSSSLVKGLVNTFSEISMGIDIKVCPGGTDARHLNNRYGVPTVIFGPGELAMAHAVNECLSLHEWERSAQAMALFITHWCR